MYDNLEIKPNSLLLCIDYQNDFCNPDGSLYIVGSSFDGLYLAEFLRENHVKFKRIKFTMDCHPVDHVSFTINDGPWPPHCLNGTWGSNITNVLEDYLYYDNVDIMMKGMKSDTEEYSIISRLALHIWDNIYICGEALDVCVKTHIEDIFKSDYKGDVYLLEDFCSSIGPYPNFEQLYPKLKVLKNENYG